MQHIREATFSLQEKAAFECNGLMIESSRNAVLEVHAVRLILRKMALMGLNLAMLCTVRGSLGSALAHIDRALSTASKIYYREYVVGSRHALGILYAELFAPDHAQGQLEEALSLAEELRSPTWIHIVRGALAGVHLMLDDVESAEACLGQVITPQTAMDTLGKRYCWVRKAELALAQGDPALALDTTVRLTTSAPGMSTGRVITYLWKLKGEALVAMGRLPDAEPLPRIAIDNARAAGEQFLLWRLHADLGHVCRAAGQHVEAEVEFAVARELIETMAGTISDEGLKGSFLRGGFNTLDVG
jgi:tetratricopeptide (TPR) repeat protein